MHDFNNTKSLPVQILNKGQLKCKSGWWLHNEVSARGTWPQLQREFKYNKFTKLLESPLNWAIQVTGNKMLKFFSLFNK